MVKYDENGLEIEALRESVIAAICGICGYLIFRGIKSWMKRRGTLEGVLG